MYIHRCPVRFTHTDPAGFVFYPRFFEMFQAAVEDWFSLCLGIDYADQIIRQRIGLPTAHTECDFALPCRLGEILELKVVLRHIGTSSLVIDFLGSVAGEARLKASSTLVTISLDDGRPRPITPPVRERLNAYAEVCRADTARTHHEGLQD